MRRVCKLSFVFLIVAIASLNLNNFAATGGTLLRQDPPSQKTPDSAKAKPAEQKPADYSQEAFVIEQARTIYRFESDGTGLRENRMRVKIQSEAGVQAFGQLIFPFSSANEKMEIDYVRVLKKDGSVVNANETNFQELTAPVSRIAPVYTDVKGKVVTVPGLRPGDTLEYHITARVFAALAANQFWMEHEFVKDPVIVLDERLEVNIPQSRVVKLKTETGFDPSIKEEGGRRIYSWTHTNLKHEEKDEKKDADPFARLRELEEGEVKPPPVQMTTFKDWNEVGQWYGELQRDRIIPDDKIRAKVAELTRGKNTDLEKIEAIYSFVAKNFRYVSLSFGQGRFQPHAATEILSNEYGDCKDKHTLLASMLSAAGIQAFPVLINALRKIDPDMPSPSQFNHVITAIPRGQELIWLDTTPEVAPFRMLSSRLRKKQALFIPDNAVAKLETTPADLPFRSSLTVEMTGKVDEKGKITGQAHLTVRGDEELDLRSTFRRIPKTQWKGLSSMLNYELGLGYSTEISEVAPGDPNATEKPFEIDYEFSYEMSRYRTWSPKEGSLELPMPTFRLPDLDSTLFLKDKTDKPEKKTEPKPIELGKISDVTFRLKLTLPKSFKSQMPVPITLTRDYAEYHSSYKLEGDTVIAERALKLRQLEIPAERRQDYQSFFKSTISDQGQRVSIESDIVEAPTPPTVPESMKVEELIEGAREAMQESTYEKSETMLNRALEKDPQHKETRVLLGYVLTQEKKYEAAVKVLNEQIKINPYDESAYTYLGNALRDQKKYTEAEAAYRKQIEVTPLDKWAQGNLGRMLVDTKKFKEAVPELEMAISLHAESGPLNSLSLARAHINLGHKDKAIEAIEKAVSTSKEIYLLNDAAYLMAENDVKLDAAQGYAETAVTDMAMKLLGVKLDDLDMDDLSHVRSLASYWDTLGWVHFKEGNIDLAEKYITAAWQLGQRSALADHLGQIYEKRSQKEQAIHWYTLATVAVSPVDEAKEHLAKLADKGKIESLQSKAKEEMIQMRTIKLSPLIKDAKEKLEAEFYFMLIPTVSSTTKVGGVKFISGSEKLRDVTAALKTTSFGMSYPDDTGTKIFRRGKVTYDPGTNTWSLLLTLPSDIKSIK